MNSRLTTHINYTLALHSCVVVPGLGGFVYDTLPASFDKENHLAHPPKVCLRFHEGLSHQDGLLTERYIAVYGVSARRARIMLEEDVRSLRSALMSTRAVSLSGIGLLKLEENGRIVFSPQEEIAGGMSYGLTATSLPPHLSSQPTSSYNKPDYDGGYITLRLPKRMLAVASVIVFAFLLLLPWLQLPNPTESYTASLAPTALPISSESSSTTPQPIAEETMATSSVAHSSMWLEERGGMHYVIIATEKREELAQKHYELAQELKTPELGILHRGSMYRVSVASFSSSEEAFAFLREFAHQHPQHKTAWVYQGKK